MSYETKIKLRNTLYFLMIVAWLVAITDAAMFAFDNGELKLGLFAYICLGAFLGWRITSEKVDKEYTNRTSNSSGE